MPVAVLSEEQLRTRLEDLAGWESGGAAIGKDYKFDTFPQAVAFVVAVGFAAEAANHHPDLDIRYNRVHVELSTHSEGGVTEKDLDLAAAIEDLAERPLGFARRPGWGRGPISGRRAGRGPARGGNVAGPEW